MLAAISTAFGPPAGDATMIRCTAPQGVGTVNSRHRKQVNERTVRRHQKRVPGLQRHAESLLELGQLLRALPAEPWSGCLQHCPNELMTWGQDDTDFSLT